MLDAQALDRLALKGVLAANPLTEELCAKLRMPKQTRQRLVGAWLGFLGPVRDLGNFEVEVELHVAREGQVVGVVAMTDGKLDVGVLVWDLTEEGDETYGNIENEGLVTELWASDSKGEAMLDDEKKFLDGLWVPFEPVKMLVRDRKLPRPNDLCPCNSGKKFKKCCDRLA